MARVLERAKKLKVGAGDAPNVEMGPLVTGAHRDKVAGYIAAGVDYTEFGYKAWEKLTTMANLEQNVDLSRQLAEAGFALANRVLMAPLTRLRNTEPGDVPTALAIDYYRQRAGADADPLAGVRAQGEVDG